MNFEELKSKIIGTLIGAVVLFALAKFGLGPQTSGEAAKMVSDNYGHLPSNPSPSGSGAASLSPATSRPNYKQPARVRTRNGGKLNLRSAPSETAPVVTQVQSGTSVWILEYDKEFKVVNGESGKWCLVEANGKTGWAWGVFIQAE